MIILAKTWPGKEYIYKTRSARKVSKKSADYILQVVNKYKFDLGDNEIWCKYEIDEYDTVAFIYASNQSFTVRKGIVTARG